MKLFEGAVLLIIGSAVIGPIEANKIVVVDSVRERRAAVCYDKAVASGFNTNGYYSVWAKDKKEADRLTRQFWVTRCTNLYGTQPETTAQTCTRAMKEIGAFLHRNTPHAVYPNLAGWILDGEVIRCIPAPSGLRNK